MHETRIASDLTDIILEVARQENLNRVTDIHLRFGEMIQIVPDIFLHAFGAATEGTVAERSAVHIEIVPVRFRCERCLAETNAEDMVFRCGLCGSADLILVQGKEMVIHSIEGE